MMKYLFRARRRDHCGWCQGAYINVFEPEIVGNHGWLHVFPQTIGQFTGQTDRTGANVFEGDVLFWKEREQEHCVTPLFTKTGVVRFGEYKNPMGAEDEIHLGFYVDWKKGDLPIARKDLLFWLTTDSLKDGAVVIGNIYDNPELLEPDAGSGAEGETP